MRVLILSANTEQINMPVLPIGMAEVAAAVEQAGHNIRIINSMRMESLLKEVYQAVYEFIPDVIAVSVRNIDDQNLENPKFLLPPVKKVIDECRRLSSAPIVLGGPGYSIFPHSVLSYLGGDYGIQGEGEKVFAELLKRIALKTSVADVPGLILPGKTSGLHLQRLRRLDAYPLPLPGVHLLAEAENSDQIWVPFQTRRGCPVNCSYCSTPKIEGSVMRHRSVDLVVRNLEAFITAGYRRFFFVDNIFNLPSSYTEALCDSIIEAGLDISWQAIIYPTRLSKRVVSKMAQARCLGIALGFESGNNNILAAMNKRYTTTEVRKISDMFEQVGISRMGFLLLGGPGETRNSVEESISFAESLNLEQVKLTVGIRIYPDTPLSRQAIEDGIINSNTDLLYPKFYLQPSLDGWLQERINKLVEEKPGWRT